MFNHRNIDAVLAFISLILLACLPLVNRCSFQVRVAVVPFCLPCRIYFWDRIHAFFIVINRPTMYCVLVGGAVAP